MSKLDRQVLTALKKKGAEKQPVAVGNIYLAFAGHPKYKIDLALKALRRRRDVEKKPEGWMIAGPRSVRARCKTCGAGVMSVWDEDEDKRVGWMCHGCGRILKSEEVDL